MKRSMMIAMALMTGLWFAACGNSGQSTVAAVPAPGIGPLPGVATAPACQIGQLYNPQYGCLNQNSCPAGQGFAPTVNACVPGTVVSAQTVFGSTYQSRFYGMMTITNANQFQLLLKYSNLCDPYWTGYNFGSWSCANWVSRGGFIQLQSFGTMSAVGGNNVSLYIGAGNPATGYYSGYQMGVSQQSIGLSQQASVVDYNNNAGMQIVGVNYANQDVGLRLIVPTGHLTDNSFQAQVWYQNVQFATVNLVRY